MSKCVWDDIESEPAKAAVLKVRSYLMMRLHQEIDSWAVSRSEAANRLGVTRQRVSDLLQGNIDKFNVESLQLLSLRAELRTEIGARS